MLIKPLKYLCVHWWHPPLNTSPSSYSRENCWESWQISSRVWGRSSDAWPHIIGHELNPKMPLQQFRYQPWHLVSVCVKQSWEGWNEHPEYFSLKSLTESIGQEKNVFMLEWLWSECLICLGSCFVLMLKYFKMLSTLFQVLFLPFSSLLSPASWKNVVVSSAEIFVGRLVPGICWSWDKFLGWVISSG